MGRWVLACLAAANTWYMGWVFTVISGFGWLLVTYGLDSVWNGSSHQPDNYGPMLWAGFPAMCTGFGFSIWSSLKIEKKLKGWQFKFLRVLTQVPSSEVSPQIENASSFKTILVFVLVAQSICYAPCMSKSSDLGMISEFFIFPILCACFSGYVILQSHNPKAKDMPPVDPG